MKPNTMLRKTTGSLLMLLLLLFTACKREGPMGPEGPQGADGEDATGGGGGGGGTSGSNVMSFHTPVNANLKWEVSDGWGGYTVYELNAGRSGIKLPNNTKGIIDSGFVQVYMVGIEDDYYRLPYVTDPGKQEIYEYGFYDNDLKLFAKTKNEERTGEENPPSSNTKAVKVVMAPPTEVHTLKLTD